MITLSPHSLCDVCAEEYGPGKYPHCVPCGHVLCRNCWDSILEKATPKQTPSCPFCREHFTSDTVRLIRIDFTPISSGWSTPRQYAAVSAHGIVDDTDDDPLPTNLTKRAEVKRLEQKVARVAGKKCSVEEITNLCRELNDWLAVHRFGDQASSIQLSAALLHAILMNHTANSEAMKNEREIQTQLKDELDKKDAELRSLRSQYSKTHSDYFSELSRHKTISSSMVSPPLSSSRMPSLSPPSSTSTSRATSPTSPTPQKPSLHSPFTSRISPLTSHTRSTSVAPPNPPARSASVAPPTTPARSASVAPPSVPSYGYRSATPAARAKTPAAGILRPESVRPDRTRKLSVSSPMANKIFRSNSDETQKDKQATYPKDILRPKAYTQWLPSQNASPPAFNGTHMRSMSMTTPPRPSKTPVPYHH